MFLRALLAFLVLPGVVAGLLPWLITRADPWRGAGNLLGWVALGPGLLILLRCARDFYVAGKGTLAPWDPPRRLVMVGLYRFSRNPMYVGVLLLVAGQAVLAGSHLLGLYAALFAILFHLRVVRFEEPWLEQRFGEEWAAYRVQVRRWV